MAIENRKLGLWFVPPVGLGYTNLPHAYVAIYDH